MCKKTPHLISGLRLSVSLIYELLPQTSSTWICCATNANHRGGKTWLKTAQFPTNSSRGNTVLNRSSCSSQRISHKADSSPQKPIWAFALWDLPLWLLSGNILSRSLFSLAMFSLKKRSGSPIQKKTSQSLCSFALSPSGLGRNKVT